MSQKLFGEAANKDLLIDFRNQLLPPHHQIADLSFKNVENLPDLATERKAIFDIYCKAVSGEHFVVEMQMVPDRCRPLPRQTLALYHADGRLVAIWETKGAECRFRCAIFHPVFFIYPSIRRQRYI